MPGEIKIDDGSGNYTILTNAGSLGSDKTITIPNTTGTVALTSELHSNVSMFDRWYINGDITGTNADITANWTQITSTLLTYGENMSESSGIFTFPSTGYYKIGMYILVDKSTSEALIRLRCNYTNDNFSSQGTLLTIDFKSQTTNTERMVGYNEKVFKVDDLANDKVKFDTSSFNASTVMKNSVHESNFYFTKLREL